MAYDTKKKVKRTDSRQGSSLLESKEVMSNGSSMMQLQRTIGNKGVGQLLGLSSGGAGIVQAKKISEEGYNDVVVSSYFRDTHLAADEDTAIEVSEARSNQNGRGMRNTVIEGTAADIEAKVKDADYDEDTYQIGGNQYGIAIDVDYWQIDMLAGANGYVVNSIEEESGTVNVKGYFNTGGNLVVSGVDG